MNPGLYEAAEAQSSATGPRPGLTAKHVALPPAEFVEAAVDRDVQVAVADMRIGLDPDLYPLLASSQTLTGRSNVIGVQSAELDTLLEKARAPGSASARA